MSQTNQTTPIVDYYDCVAKDYYERKVSYDRSDLHDCFFKYLKPGAKVLDAGCGPGLDILPFRDYGFSVHAIDGSKEMVKLATHHSQQLVTCMRFDQIEFVERFDGIWTNASLLHTPTEELRNLFPRFIRALKRGGYWYMSFRYGDGMQIIGGIPSYLQTEKSLLEILNSFVELNIEELWVTPSSNPALHSWLKCLVRKN